MVVDPIASSDLVAGIEECSQPMHLGFPERSLIAFGHIAMLIVPDESSISLNQIVNKIAPVATVFVRSEHTWACLHPSVEFSIKDNSIVVAEYTWPLHQIVGKPSFIGVLIGPSVDTPAFLHSVLELTFV